MNTKNDVEVIINGRTYIISGYESSEYMQKIATHINSKYDEFKKSDSFPKLDQEMKNILLAICPMIIIKHRMLLLIYKKITKILKKRFFI